jgi:hypothetical protein
VNPARHVPGPVVPAPFPGAAPSQKSCRKKDNQVSSLLVVAIVGSCIALVVQVVSIGRWFTGRPPHGSRMRTGH